MGRAARLHGAGQEVLAALGETVEPLEGGLVRSRLRACSAMGAGAWTPSTPLGWHSTSGEIVLVLASTLPAGPWTGTRGSPQALAGP